MSDNLLMQTQHGFAWGPVEVVRVFDDQRGVVVTLRTNRRTLDVFVTPSGLLRVSEIQMRYKDKK